MKSKNTYKTKKIMHYGLILGLAASLAALGGCSKKRFNFEGAPAAPADAPPPTSLFDK